MKRLRRLSVLCIFDVILFLGFNLAAQAQTINQLFAFACDPNSNLCPNGSEPNSLIQSADGDFYGTTFKGGNGNRAAGTVFRITLAGHLTTLYTFVADQSGNYPNGANPGSLTEGNDGFFYGTAESGGDNGGGAVFKLSRTGTIQVPHSFCSATNCSDGSEPFALVLGSDGNLYGATTYSFPGLFTHVNYPYARHDFIVMLAE